MGERVEDGGPAFPHQFENADGNPRYLQSTGLTIRDYFAAQALQAVIAATSAGQHNPQSFSFGKTLELAMARDAYKMADAMLAARSPSEPLNARTQGVEVGR